MKKVVIIVLVVVVVLMIAILVIRPGGRSNRADPPGFVKAIGRLTPRQDVEAQDMAGRDCWNNTGQLTVPPGTTCRMGLPTGANRLQICLVQGQLATFEIKGDKFGPQQFDRNQIPCAGGESFDLYDDNSVLTATCLFNGPCVLRLT